jgi:hypothetical protein
MEEERAKSGRAVRDAASEASDSVAKAQADAEKRLAEATHARTEAEARAAEAEAEATELRTQLRLAKADAVTAREEAEAARADTASLKAKAEAEAAAAAEARVAAVSDASSASYERGLEEGEARGVARGREEAEAAGRAATGAAEEEAEAAKSALGRAVRDAASLKGSLTRKLKKLAAEYKVLQKRLESEQSRRLEAEAMAEVADAEADAKVSAARGSSAQLQRALEEARRGADDDAAQLRIRRERAELAEQRRDEMAAELEDTRATLASLQEQAAAESSQASEWSQLIPPEPGTAPPLPPGAEETVVGEWAEQVATSDDDAKALQSWLGRAGRATRTEARGLAVRRVQRVDESQAENFRLLILPSLASTGRPDVRVFAWWKRERRVVAKLRLATVVLPAGADAGDEEAWRQAVEEARPRVVGSDGARRGLRAAAAAVMAVKPRRGGGAAGGAASGAASSSSAGGAKPRRPQR